MEFLQPDSENLLNTRFKHMARNTIDYWMTSDSESLDTSQIIKKIKEGPVNEHSSLQLYLHIPFCAQKCSFCAFSGGNSLDFKAAQTYVGLLIKQLYKILEITPVYQTKRIRSVHIGGGSPDLVGSSIGKLFEAIRRLKGFDQHTEIAVECSPSTTKKEFLEECKQFEITKLSFGVQSINREIRKNIRMPASIRKVEEICAYVAGSIPIVNADFNTGLPGQTLQDVDCDLQYAINHPVINAISTYLLTPGAAPALIADVKSQLCPNVPTHSTQAAMRLHSYSTLQQEGWVRKGTNTYMDPKSINATILENIPGNECIGAAHYDTYLVAAGAQAIGSSPGVRYENIVNIEKWKEEIENGGFGLNLRKSSIFHQHDMSLWSFPLFYQGLSKQRFNELVASDHLDETQVETFQKLISEGLIVERPNKYQLTMLGEVFMGHIVKLLKKNESQKVLDEYIEEGFMIANAIKSGSIPLNNASNDRQIIVGKI